MRVLVVNAHGADMTAGGAERYVAELGRGLPAMGCELALLAAFPARMQGWPSQATVLHTTDWRDDPVRRWRNHLGDLASFPTGRLRAAVAAVAPDIVHTHNLPGITTAIWEVCRRAGVPVVHTIHDYYLHCPRVTLLKRSGEPCNPHPLLCGMRSRRLVRWAHAVGDVIAVSEHVAKLHAHMFDASRVHVVPCALTPLARPLSPARTPPRAVGYLGALASVKGIGRLLEAAPRLARLGLRVRIAGSGKLRTQVEDAAAASIVEYVGEVHGEDKIAFIESCDLGILPSLWNEPGAPPYSVYDWLAGGRPVLVSRRGGLREAADRFPCVVPIEPTIEGMVEAVSAVLAPGRFRCLLDQLPGVDDDRDLRRWLDAHREIYQAAIVRRDTLR